jgi:hypothetical protein
MHRVLIAALIMSATAAGAASVNYKSLSDEFRRNEAGFQQKYVGQSITVAGSLVMIRLNLWRTGPISGPAIGLSDPDKVSVNCYLNDADKQRALNLGRGDNVVLSGTVYQANVSGIHLQPCTFL